VNPTTPATQPTSPPPAPSPWKAAFSNKAFVLAVVVLAIAAAGLNTAARALDMYFKKVPVPLRHRLDDDQAGLPKELGHWVMVQQTSSLNEDVQHTLGTKEFVFRTYVNSRVATRETADNLARLSREAEALDESDKEQAKTKVEKQLEFAQDLRRLQLEHPDAVMTLNITFYTGMVDTVAHIPEHCLVADGYEPKDPRKVAVTAGEYPDGSPRPVEIQFSTFEDQTGHGRVSRNVGYFFHCNGSYTPSAVGVRGRLQNLFERYGYYAKVEMMTDDPGVGRERSARDDVNQRSIDAMADLLAVALPEVERCLPDWKQVKAQAPGKDQVAAK
jgi:hypothetical protein